MLTICSNRHVPFSLFTVHTVLLHVSGIPFTLPHGERLTSFSTFFSSIDFNSRSLVGSGVPEKVCCCSESISIHVPSWGAAAKTTNLSLYLSFLFIQMRQIFSTSHFCLLWVISKTPLFQVRTSWRFHVCYTFALQAISLIFSFLLLSHFHCLSCKSQFCL